MDGCTYVFSRSRGLAIFLGVPNKHPLTAQDLALICYTEWMRHAANKVNDMFIEWQIKCQDPRYDIRARFDIYLSEVC